MNVTIKMEVHSDLQFVKMIISGHEPSHMPINRICSIKNPLKKIFKVAAGIQLDFWSTSFTHRTRFKVPVRDLEQHVTRAWEEFLECRPNNYHFEGNIGRLPNSGKITVNVENIEVI